MLLMTPCRESQHQHGTGWQTLRLFTFLFIRVYLWEMGSIQMISPVEKPKITSMWDAPLVTVLTSWHRQCAFVKRILVK